jgi:hypothetical protein
MTSEVATIQSPFEALKHTDEDGDYWLAREMWQPAGYAQWQNFEPLVQRAITAAEAVFPGQIVFMVDHENPTGPRGGRPSKGDYRCTRYGAYMILSRSDKPELADYFVMQTMFAENVQAAGLRKSEVVEILREHGSQLDQIGYYQDGSVRYVRFKRAQPHSLRSEIEELLQQDIASDEENDSNFENDYNVAVYKPVLAERITAWLSRFFPQPKPVVVTEKVRLDIGTPTDRAAHLMYRAFLSGIGQTWGLLHSEVPEGVDYNKVAAAVTYLDPSTRQKLYVYDGPVTGDVPGFFEAKRIYLTL